MNRTEITIVYRDGPAVEISKKDGTPIVTLNRGQPQLTLFLDEAASLRQVDAVLPARERPRPVVETVAQLAAGAMASVNPDPSVPDAPPPGSDVHAPLTTSETLQG